MEEFWMVNGASRNLTAELPIEIKTVHDTPFQFILNILGGRWLVHNIPKSY